jgi:hypothetical protein
MKQRGFIANCTTSFQDFFTIIIWNKKQSKAVPLRHAGAKVDRIYISYLLSTSALDVVSGQRHAPAAFYPGESTHWKGGLVGLGASLDTEARGKILCLC